MASPSLEKRIKRQLVARTLPCFAATHPGTEDLCQAELTQLGLAPQSTTGGFDLDCRLHELYEANLHSRLCSRFWLRLGDFKAKGWQRLREQLDKIPWELHLQPHRKVRCRASSSHSRLYHTDGICGALFEVLSKRGFTPKEGQEPAQLILLRAVDDRFTLSLDSSGEHLHKRGLRPLNAQAPLRENLAAWMLKALQYDPANHPLVDPMCGSGTFAIEAALMATQTAPGLARDFAFSHWPSFQQGRWRHARRQAIDAIHPAPQPIFASDIDTNTISHLTTAVAELDAKIHPQHNHLSCAIEVRQADFFSSSHPGLPPGVILLNPPYGERLASNDPFMLQIGRHLRENYRGWRAGIILPKAQASLLGSLGLKGTELLHGGTRRSVLLGKIL